MSPPSSAQFQETFNAVWKQVSKPDVLFRQAMQYTNLAKLAEVGWQPIVRGGLRGFELFGFFVIGEMIGRRSIKGYQVWWWERQLRDIRAELLLLMYYSNHWVYPTLSDIAMYRLWFKKFIRQLLQFNCTQLTKLLKPRRIHLRFEKSCAHAFISSDRMTVSFHPMLLRYYSRVNLSPGSRVDKRRFRRSAISIGHASGNSLPWIVPTNMDRQTLKLEKEKFVSGLAGGSISEVNAVTSVALVHLLPQNLLLIP